SFELIEKINFAMGTENQNLLKENELIKRKNLFLTELFIRSYIEQYDLKNLALKKYQIYTVDALADLRKYAEIALGKFKENWNSEICNEQCEWTKEFLENLIPRIDSMLWGNDVFDSENEEAFRRFFLGVQTNLFFDRNAKKTGRKIEKLDYWRPQEKHHESC
ncbi:hypothetical protein IKO18_06445, partial [bacterium]|nr:hypothetical protein [bacterium]